ncbi:head GIN domain-containing protein [Xanthovirga aplysinae]|uniref:head GIN domain-containing protein n=1 Tax=Xanthovirga aplysinae TaxID=2529853 RepID=UPI0012BC4FAE|nr:head GIN domain-containing protein [Xanthovirga aplysinae]MTI31842.1 DUF2807 domain-containing protein [Xanthovirga aplysinae]
MKKLKATNLILFLFLALNLFSCNSPDALDCLKSTGNTIQQDVDLPAFHTIEVFDNINLVLRPEPTLGITIEAGKNIVPKIRLEVKDSVLYIRNDNSCNWVRKYKEINVFVNLSNTRTIVQSGAGILRSAGQLDVDRLDLFVNNTGDVELSVKGNMCILTSHELSNIKIRGELNYFNVQFGNVDGKLLAKDLKSKTIDILHEGTNTMELYPTESLTGTITGKGEVIYFNKPKKLSVSIYSTGSLKEGI